MPTSAAGRVRSTAGCVRVAWLLGALALSAGCATAVDALDVEAARTTAQVVTAIVNDPEIGTRTIDVRVSHGVVYLSGRVRNEDEAARAIELARSAPGVTRVDSRLGIGADPPPPDDPPPSVRARTVHDPAAEFAELEGTPGLLAIGVSFGWSDPGHEPLTSGVSVGPIVRLGSGSGFGPALALDWFRTDVPGSPDRPVPSSRLRVRPFMAGISYTLVSGAVSISPSLVGGYAFNRIAVPNAGPADRIAVDVRNSFAWRPGVSIWIDTSRRTAVNVSAGRLMTRLKVGFVDAGRLDQQTLSGDTTIVRVGLAYKLF